MREIKFRALGQTTNKWYYGIVSMITEFVCNIVSDYEHTWICDAKTLSQYTGLKDKNGTEIYEGDIVKCDYFTGVVEYRENAGIYLIGNKEEGKAITFFDIHMNKGKVEVKGNIYENPELLEGRK